MSITSANAVFQLNVKGFPQIQVQKFGVDDAFANDAVTPMEGQMGVDGFLAFGRTPYPVKLHITLQADSSSILLFDQWMQAMNQPGADVIICTANIVVPGIKKNYTCTKGGLIEGMVLPDAKKVLGPQKYTILFETIIAMPTN